ncbi:MAG: alpha/beta hydrolase [Bacteroidetes bacterium]|nr:alpha/beta hydrolase [Bacteroidota bacterium]
MKNVYCISGLGADERIFSKLAVDGVNFIYLPWVVAQDADTVETYAAKMAATIPEPDPIILGMSFGGMLAVEIAKIMPVKKLFLISSAKTKHELGEDPGIVKFFIKYKLIPFGILKHFPNKIFYSRFGAQTEEEKKMLAGILRDTDTVFLKWAMKALLTWNNETYCDDYVQLHGTKDKIISPRYVNPDFWIDGGTHIMIYSLAGIINGIIARHL